MNKNKFTVVIVTYNRPKELLISLNSVINQKFQASEIIIINNHKTKITKNILGTSLKSIKIINSKRNLFSANGRNFGVYKSNFEYIAFLDDDDQWSNKYLLEANKIINNQNPDAILTNVYKSKSKNMIFKKVKDLNIQECFIRNPGCMGSNLIVKKEKFFQIKGFNKNFIPAEDREFLIRMLLNRFKISVSKSKIFYNDENPSSITKNLSLTLNGHTNLMLKYKRYINLKNKMFINFKLNRLKFLLEKNYLYKYFYLFKLISFYILQRLLK